jgi:hypothetical protein
MPTTWTAEPAPKPQADPKPLGDPQPPKPEINPVPAGDPPAPIPGQEPRSKASRQISPLFALYASKKVDDLSRHEARHDEPLTRKPLTPNAREKPLDRVKPTGNPPPGVKSTKAEFRA